MDIIQWVLIALLFMGVYAQRSKIEELEGSIEDLYDKHDRRFEV